MSLMLNPLQSSILNFVTFFNQIDDRNKLDIMIKDLYI
jgi:hypothetical protein